MKKVASVILLSLLNWFVLPGTAFAWWNEDWSFRTKITVDPMRVQPAVSGKLERVPVLVRLHEGNFRFLDARSDGTDLRFIAGDDKTPLTYHIEAFDGVASLAWIWVDVPSIEAGKPQDIWLYYGNADAKAVANAPLTWDGETALVYHFNETAGAPRDYTANGNNAVSTNAQPSFESLIRQGVAFNGSQQVRIAASASLRIAPEAPMTWSAWLKAEAEKPQDNATVYTKFSAAGETSPARLVIGLNQNRPFVRVIDATGAVQEAVAKNQIPVNAWMHLALVAAEQVRLYVNGVEVAALPLKLPELDGEAVLGANLAVAGSPSATAPTAVGLIGTLDELNISNTARSTEWLAFAAATQGREASLLTFAPKAEVRGQWFSGGYIAVLMRAVTIDGWVVIGILMIMLVISIAVMVARLNLIKRAAAANNKFKPQFADIVVQMARLKRTGALDAQGFPQSDDAEIAEDSPLYRLYHAGTQELRQRAALEDGQSLRLDPISANALRATMDSALVEEQQALNKQMVFLTIAISGGPFLGLLGTVVGVMITFAAIAEAGDVNVNAIAPGVAAALMATVAGLAVAIPALFAYNYLTTRIADIAADMQVFVNEFVSKMTELFRE